MNNIERMALENNKLRNELKLAREELKQCQFELETERMKLAACGIAAIGQFSECMHKYESISLRDVIKLRPEFEALKTKRPD